MSRILTSKMSSCARNCSNNTVAGGVKRLCIPIRRQQQTTLTAEGQGRHPPTGLVSRKDMPPYDPEETVSAAAVLHQLRAVAVQPLAMSRCLQQLYLPAPPQRAQQCGQSQNNPKDATFSLPSAQYLRQQLRKKSA